MKKLFAVIVISLLCLPALCAADSAVYTGYEPRHLTAGSTGLTYALTATPAVVTGAATLTIDQPGTYVLSGLITADFSAATFAAVRSASCYLYRTNNTPAAVSYSTATAVVPIITTITLAPAMTLAIPPVSYTAINSNDILAVYCSVNVIPTAGSMRIITTYIQGVRP